MKLRLSLAFIPLLIAACGQPPLSGPPPARTGRDECSDCGMLVAEERCSCGALIEREGVREHLIFDDLGCLLEFQRDPDRNVRVLTWYVRDHGSGAWVEADAATYVVASPDAAPTPMGSGIVAYKAAESARTFAERVSGLVVPFSELKQAREIVKARIKEHTHE